MKPLFITIACATIAAAQTLVAQNLQWERVPQLDTTVTVRAFEVHGQYLFMGANRYGLHRSSDYGNTWENDSSMIGADIEAFVVNNQDLFVGVKRNAATNVNDGIFRSTDSGSTWKQVEQYHSTTGFGKIGSRLVAGHALAPPRYLQLGKYWLQGAGYQGSIVFCQADSVLVAVIINYGVCRSLDSGKKNWSVTDFKDTISTLYGGNGVLLAGTSKKGIYHSTDLGATWSGYNTGITDTIALNVATFHAVSQYLYAGSSKGMYYSANNGALWQKAGDAGLNSAIVKILYSHGPYLFAGTDKGVFRAKLPAVGVGEPPAPSGISISPNPASDGFTVQCPDFATVAVRDVFGRIKSINDEATKGGKTISTADYVSGVYFVEIMNADGSRATATVIINH